MRSADLLQRVAVHLGKVPGGGIVRQFAVNRILGKFCPIVNYHAVNNGDQGVILSNHVHNVPPMDFRHQVQVLKRQFSIVTIDEYVRMLQTGAGRRDVAAITFDDGYRDNLERALPVLQQHDLPATVFITTGTLDRCMWNDVAIELLRQAPPQGFDSGALDLGTLPTGNITRFYAPPRTYGGEINFRF